MIRCLVAIIAAAFINSATLPALGKKPEEGPKGIVSHHTHKQEAEVKAKMDSLLAIYDPWKAIQQYKEQEESLKKANTSKADILGSLKELDRKYPHSRNGDAVLFNIAMLNLDLRPGKLMNVEGERFASHNPKYDEHYRETLGYALRLADEYPESKYADKALLRIGLQYAGFLDERDGKYIKPFVEIVKRFPESRFIMIPLFMISEAAENDTGGADFETRMWAYSLWRKKYDDGYFYLNYFDDPKIEALYNDKRNRNRLMDEINREKQEVGISLLTDIASSIGHSLSGFLGNNPSIEEINTNDANKIYKLLSPYCRETDVFKKINPFEKYPDLKVKHFYANRDRYNYKLKLFDVERTWTADKSVPKPKRR